MSNKTFTVQCASRFCPACVASQEGICRPGADKLIYVLEHSIHLGCTTILENDTNFTADMTMYAVEALFAGLVDVDRKTLEVTAAYDESGCHVGWGITGNDLCDKAFDIVILTA